jgi:protein-L-isoaspartate O-methyltransferase
MLIPLAQGGAQTLTLVQRAEDGFVRRALGDVHFVPLIGEHGYDA